MTNGYTIGHSVYHSMYILQCTMLWCLSELVYTCVCLSVYKNFCISTKPPTMKWNLQSGGRWNISGMEWVSMWSIDNLPILLSHKCLCFLHWQTFLFMTMIHVHLCYHFLVLLFSLKELLMYLYLQHLCKQHQYFSKICIICKICVILLFPDSILKQHVSNILAKQMSGCYPCLLEYLHEAVMETFIKKS